MLIYKTVHAAAMEEYRYGKNGKKKNFIILILLAAMSVLAVFGCGALHGQALAEVAADRG